MCIISWKKRVVQLLSELNLNSQSEPELINDLIWWSLSSIGVDVRIEVLLASATTFTQSQWNLHSAAGWRIQVDLDRSR